MTKQESISNEDEDSLCGRVNHLSASGNSWSRPEAPQSQLFSRHPKVEHVNNDLQVLELALQTKHYNVFGSDTN